ncbi:MAG: PEGA domain-containing protein [Myxococcales bacterium]|nr:PEGA domain-containing protein [Myxococcales bacterium]MCB9731249.1 PEGA domain-containing protein [Deltaproteobacteria bacterium]
MKPRLSLFLGRAAALAVATSFVTTTIATPVLAAEPALADTARQIVIVGLAADEKENAEFLGEVQRAVEEHVNAEGKRDYQLKDPNPILNAGGEAQDRQNIATAKGFLDAGQASMQAEDFEDAVDQLGSAVNLLETSYGVLEDRSVYQSALLLLGEARRRRGDKAGALQAFRRAATIKTDAEGLSDAGRALFAQAAKELESSPAGAVQVNTEPPYAEVYVDGKFRGLSPRLVAGLAEGSHIVSVNKVGFARTSKRVDVSSTKMAHEELKLEPARRALLLDELKPKLAAEIDAAKGDVPVGGAAVEELGKLFRTETALIVRLEGPETQKSLGLYLFHTETKRLVSKVEIAEVDWSFKNKAAVDAAVKRVFDVNWTEALGGEVAEEPDDDGGSVTSEWWFWTLIGAAVAGGTVAAILLTQDDASPPPYDHDGSGAVVFQF